MVPLKGVLTTLGIRIHTKPKMLSPQISKSNFLCPVSDFQTCYH